MPVDTQGVTGRVIQQVASALLTLLTAGFGRPLAAQHTLRGQVVDTTGVGLVGVEVVLAEAGRNAVTGSGGRYTVSNIPAGRFEVVFRRLGYAPFVIFRSFVGDTGTTTVDVRLAAEAVPLKLQGWAWRRKMNVGGKFWDDSLLRTLEHRRLSDVLRSVSGARIVGEGGFSFLTTYGGRAGVMRGGHCEVVVYLDGLRIGIPRKARFNLNDVPVNQIAAMEFYRSTSEIPVEFNSPGSMCGVLAIWTRVGGGR